MALRFFDGFDHYSDELDKWTSRNGSGFIQTSGGRFGGAIANPNNLAWLRLVLDAQPTLIVGMAFKMITSLDSLIFAIQDGGSNQLEVSYIASTGKLRLTRNGTTLDDGTTVVAINVFHYLELKATIDNAGTATVDFNENSEITFSGGTQATANPSADGIQIWGDTDSQVWIDDLYVCDGTGSAPYQDFLGDVRVEALYPNGNGTTSQFVGSDSNSTDNYLLVDESPPNDDTDYVQSATIGNKDTYNFTNLTPTTGTVYGVQVLPYARKTDAGTRKICSVARLSGNESDSADKTLLTDYLYHPDIRTEKPGTGAWSITDVNNAEFGAKVTA